MSEKTVEELESEYKTLLASKINNMAKEEADKQAIVAAQLVEDAAKAEEEKLAAMFEKQTGLVVSSLGIGRQFTEIGFPSDMEIVIDARLPD